MTTETADQHTTPSRRRAWLWMLPLAGVVGLLIGFYIANRSDAAPLTQARLADAKQRWAARGPDDYRLTIDLAGSQTVRYVVTVRDGTVVDMKSDGQSAPRHVWPSWSVPGLFTFLETELRNAAKPQAAFGVDDRNRIVLRAAFDGQYGYPSTFMRHVLGTQQQVQWEVTSFEPLP